MLKRLNRLKLIQQAKREIIKVEQQVEVSSSKEASHHLDQAIEAIAATPSSSNSANCGRPSQASPRRDISRASNTNKASKFLGTFARRESRPRQGIGLYI